MHNSKSAIIQVGQGLAFIDGRDHVCDSRGDIIYETASGRIVYWHTQRQWAHLTTEAREPLLYAHYQKIDDPICAGSVSCSVCKEAAMHTAVWEDWYWSV